MSLVLVFVVVCFFGCVTLPILVVPPSMFVCIYQLYMSICMYYLPEQQELVGCLEHTQPNLKLEQCLQIYEAGLLPWDIEMTVEEPLSDDEDGTPYSLSPTPSPSLNPKKTLTKFRVI